MNTYVSELFTHKAAPSYSKYWVIYRGLKISRIAI